MRAQPPEHGLRELMAQAAAAASAATADPSLTAAPDPARPPRAHTRPPSRRHTLNRIAQLHIGHPLPKTTSLPPPTDGQRLARIDEVAHQIERKWTHPAESVQYETRTLHQVRAILYMNKSLVTQSFVSGVSGVSQGSLSHYVRGLFKGNQDNVEERLATFVTDFAEGKYDPLLDDTRPQPRPVSADHTLHNSAAANAAAAAAAAAACTNPSHPHLHSLPAAGLARPHSAPADPSNPPIPPPPPPQLRPAPWAPPPLPLPVTAPDGVAVAAATAAVSAAPVVPVPAMASVPAMAMASVPAMAMASVPAMAMAAVPAAALPVSVVPSTTMPTAVAPMPAPILVPAATPVSTSAPVSAPEVTSTAPPPPQLPATAAGTAGAATATPERSLGPQQLSERARRAHRRRSGEAARPRARAVPPSFPPVPDDSAHPLTPMLAVDRAFHALVAPIWSDEHPDTEPLLIPIELYVGRDAPDGGNNNDKGEKVSGTSAADGNHVEGKPLHMFTQWDVNERYLSPEVVAERIRRVRRLPMSFAEPAAKQMRRALFRAGVVCPAPPRAPEDRRLLRLAVELHDSDVVHLLRDECEWDISMPALNSPEVFAQHLCADAHVSQRHAPTVARALRERIALAQALSYGDEDTKKEARAQLSDDDPLLQPLAPVRNALTKAPTADLRAKEREENEAFISEKLLDPLVNEIPDMAEKRRLERLREEERKRVLKEMEEVRMKEEEESKQREEYEESAVQDAEDEALRIYEERNLDFRPYLGLIVGRGERPCLWMPPAFDRRRRKQLTFPMTQHQRKSAGGRANPNSRASKRRRTSRREDTVIPEKRSATAEKDDVSSKRARESEETVPNAPGPSKGSKQRRVAVSLKLRLKPPEGWVPTKQKSAEKKRRR